MYEHLRNDFLLGLTPFFNTEEINQIGFVLDKIVKDYDISEKTTALSVINNEIPRIARLYIASKRLEGISEATADLYSNSLRLFFEEMQKNPEDITTNDIRMYLVTYQMKRKISDRSLDKYRQVINGFFQWCLNEEYISKNPCKNIKEIKYEVEPRRSLTRLQLEQVRRTCECSRDLAIIDVLYSTGCRVTELVNMKFSDINSNDNSITIVGKGRKHNIVYLNTNAQLSLAEYIKERKGDSEYIFVSLKAPYNKLTKRSVEHMCSVIANKLNIKLSPHILRHTSATLALQSGMSITQVQKMLGHSSVSTTQIYAETSQEEVAVSHRKYVI